MSIYRNSVFFVKGVKEYTKGGYEAAEKDFNEKDIPSPPDSLKGKAYIVTGSNSGIGKYTGTDGT
tara:strand:+ start:361 stop:555 length:195 start_codon:yes stop_codon:yes gene_type:complete